ncbi:MAG: SRPBCC family protein [Candidatus Sulfotelmatobacter sp.]
MQSASVTPDNDGVSCEIQIAAPPERVFQAITDPSQLPKWWGQSEMYRVTKMESDLRVNGNGRALASTLKENPSKSAASI